VPPLITPREAAVLQRGHFRVLREEEIPPSEGRSGSFRSSILRSFRFTARCELQPATTGRCRTKRGRKCLGERCRESLFPFFSPFGSPILPGPSRFIRTACRCQAKRFARSLIKVRRLPSDENCGHLEENFTLVLDLSNFSDKFNNLSLKAKQQSRRSSRKFEGNLRGGEPIVRARRRELCI